MSLLQDFKTFAIALVFGAVLTLGINYVVVNHTEGPAAAQAANNASYDDGDESYETPKAAPKYEGGGSYGSYY